ncbi:MAG: hypothetical protein ACOCWZ_05075 [Spirochaetota bacterium]
MKKLATILIIMAMALAVVACGSKESASDKAVEPKTEKEFQAALKDLGITMYEGSEITGIKTGSNSELFTFVPADKGNADAIMKHYTSELEKAFSDNNEWVRQMKSPVSIMYRKGYTGWIFGVSVAKADDGDGQKVTITYGDNAVSY